MKRATLTHLRGDADLPLTPQERRFVEFYLGEAELNGIKALTLAGWKQSPKSLRVTSQRVLKKANIARAIREHAAAMDVCRSKVLGTLELTRTGHILHLFDLDEDNSQTLIPNFHKMRSLGREGIVKKVKINRLIDGKTGNVKETIDLELHDPVRAAVEEARILGLMAPASAGDEAEQGGQRLPTLEAAVLGLLRVAPRLGLWPPLMAAQFHLMREQGKIPDGAIPAGFYDPLDRPAALTVQAQVVKE